MYCKITIHRAQEKIFLQENSALSTGSAAAQTEMRLE